MNSVGNEDHVVASTTPEPSPDGLTIAETVQLMLGREPGRLVADQIVPVAGALIELAVLGRITSVEKKGEERGHWYPDHARETVDAILRAEEFLTLSGS
jgi:hypothetical protein